MKTVGKIRLYTIKLAKIAGNSLGFLLSIFIWKFPRTNKNIASVKTFLFFKIHYTYCSFATYEGDIILFEDKFDFYTLLNFNLYYYSASIIEVLKWY